MSKSYGTNIKRSTDHNGVCCFRSKLESDWAYWLDFQLKHKLILNWEYEPEFYEFPKYKHGTTRYLPDFRITELDGSITIHETKGVVRGKDITKIRRIKQEFPELKYWLIFQKHDTRSKSKSMRHRINLITPVINLIDRLVSASDECFCTMPKQRRNRKV